MARAAAAAGTVMCLSTLATTPAAEVAAAAPEGRRWFQLYAFKDAAVTRALMDEAIDSGFEAILVTVDAPPRRQPRARPPQRLHDPRRSSASQPRRGAGGERALTIEETFALMNPALTWADSPTSPPNAASRSSSRAW